MISFDDKDKARTHLSRAIVRLANADETEREAEIRERLQAIFIELGSLPVKR